MSFAELVSDMTDVCFSDAGVGEAATYTAPTVGAVTVEGVRAVLDEPNESPFPRELPRSGFKERITSVWIWRKTTAGDAVVPAKDGVLVITTSHGVVSTLKLVGQESQDPDRVQWNVREVTA